MSEFKEMEKPQTRDYVHNRALKYGCNPHQKPANIYQVKGNEMPFEVLNGNPGYINFMDALNAWQLVKELRAALDLPAAASFKHVSPAGAAVAVPLSDVEKEVYGCAKSTLTPSATAYVRARQADPKSSFGDFAALSDKVDEATAKILKREVSDGIIAPGFDEAALEILKKKKGGKYIIIKVDPSYTPPEHEFREVFGVCFQQKRNAVQFTVDHLKEVVTKNKDITEDAKRDMLVASIAVKYTQSNSVGFAKSGQMVGVGAGQQSRVDCVKLAGGKVAAWHLRFHPKVRALKFKPKQSRPTKANARMAYIQGNMTKEEQTAFEAVLEEIPEPLTEEEKTEYINSLTGVTLSSDAFFPFRDNIDTASKFGVSYLVQPGGSVQDKQVTAAADEYNMVMSHTGTRLFHH
jgi:phosphoribosylaminoimidazolecarboxamide formyltransferase/IMP cyclohydrolase